MKAKTTNQGGSFTGPLLAKIVERDLANYRRNFPEPSIGSKPLPPPSLYQDPGGAYNRNLTYPQK